MTNGRSKDTGRDGKMRPPGPKPRPQRLTIKPKERPASKGRVHKGRTQA